MSGLDAHEPFLARDDEQDRFRSVLAQVLADDEGSDQGYLVLVHGRGGIGKTTLLEQYRRMLCAEPEGDHPVSGKFLVAAVDWEIQRLLDPHDYPRSGPSLLRALEVIAAAITESVASNQEARQRADRAFREFRELAAQPAEVRPETGAGGPGPQSTQAALGALAAAAALLEPDGRLVASGVRPPAAEAAETPGAEPQAGGGQVGRQQSEPVIRPNDALARSFADGLRELSRGALPLVLSMDAAEILRDALVPLFDVIKHSGHRVVWLVGMRLESDQQAPAGSAANLYLRQLHSARMRSISPSRFTTGDVEEYLRARLGSPLPAGVTAEAVTRLSGGIPLGVKLAVSLLRKGMPPQEVLREVTADGELSGIVSGLARRYLIHAVRGGIKHDPDLDLVFGLALLESTRDHPELLGALWRVKPKAVAAIRDSLSGRHDLVLSGEPLLHQAVRDSIRLFLLDPDQRAKVRAANERARQVLRRRLARLGPATVAAQLDSDRWCSTAEALLWHTLWLDDQEGLRLLAHLLPAALLLRPAFARRLLAVTEHFCQVLPREFQLVVAGLRVLATASPFLDRLRTFFESADQADQEPLSRGGLDAAVEMLQDSTSYPDPVLAPDIPGRVLLHVLAAQYPGSFGLDPMARLTLLARVDAVLARHDGDPGTIWPIAAACAEELAQSLFTSPETLDAAAQAAELATRGNPRRARSWRILADSHRLLEHDQTALAAYDRALRLDPDDAASYGNRGLVLGRLGWDEEALAAYDQAVLLDPDDAATHFVRGSALLRLGRDTEALAAYDQAVLLDPDVAASHFKRGVVLWRLGWEKEALAAYDQAVLLDPDVAAGHAARGFVLRRLGRDEESLAAYDQAVLLDPDDAASHGNRGLALGRLGWDEEALAAYDQAVLLDPDDVVHHFERAFVLARLGRDEEALAGYDQAVLLDPDSAASHFGRAAMLGRLGRDTEALAGYDHALRLDPDDAACHGHRGMVLERLGRPEEEALAAYDQALRLDPADVVSHCNRAYGLGRLGRHVEALAAYEQALRLDPANAAAHSSRGMALARLGRRTEALAAYSQALRLDPDDIAGHGNRGEMLMFLGRSAGAAADLREAIRLQDAGAPQAGAPQAGAPQAGAPQAGAPQASAPQAGAPQASAPQAGAPQASALQARVLLAVLLRGTDPAEAAGLCEAALQGSGLEVPAFRRGELRALARLILGETDQAEAELRAAAAHHQPGDIFQQRLYELLADPPAPGLERLSAVWREILSAQDQAVAAGGHDQAG